MKQIFVKAYSDSTKTINDSKRTHNAVIRLIPKEELRLSSRAKEEESYN